jgi:hypothetical protein
MVKTFASAKVLLFFDICKKKTQKLPFIAQMGAIAYFCHKKVG